MLGNQPFDPMNNVPQNDDEAIIALKYGRDEFYGGCLVGIFQCYRGMGNSILDAYEKALRAGIGERND